MKKLILTILLVFGFVMTNAKPKELIIHDANNSTHTPDCYTIMGGKVVRTCLTKPF